MPQHVLRALLGQFPIPERNTFKTMLFPFDHSWYQIFHNSLINNSLFTSMTLYPPIREKIKFLLFPSLKFLSFFFFFFFSEIKTGAGGLSTIRTYLLYAVQKCYCSPISDVVPETCSNWLTYYEASCGHC